MTNIVRSRIGRAVAFALENNKNIDLSWPERSSTGEYYCEVVFGDSETFICLPVLTLGVYNELRSRIVEKFAGLCELKILDSDSEHAESYFVELSGQKYFATFCHDDHYGSIDIVDCPPALGRAIARILLDAGYFSNSEVANTQSLATA